jgi:hypothetical protein
MVKNVNTTPGPNAINLQDLVVDAPMRSAKLGEKMPKPSVPKLNAPTTEQVALKPDMVKEKAAQFAPTLLQPLASLPPIAPVPAQSPQPQVFPTKENTTHHGYGHIFITEKMD